MSAEEGASTPTDRQHLEHSRPLRWTRVAHDEAAELAIEHLVGLLEAAESRTRARRPDDRKRLRETMEAMVLDLYLAETKEAGLYVAYSRRKADYGETGEHPGASLTSVTQVADFLTAAGFAEGHRGSYARRANPFGCPETGTGYRSRLRATPALIELLEGMFGVSAESVGAGQGVAGQPIRLKGRAARGEVKERVRFKHTPATEAMGRRVVAANRLRASCE